MFSMDLLVFLGALSIAAFSPGPWLAAIIATTMASGARRTVWFCVGIIMGDLVWLGLSLSGLAVIARQIPMVFVVIKWAGVAYLVYLAFRIWRSDVGEGAETVKPPEKGVLARVLAGFSVTMGNPKAMLFYIALLPSIMDPGRVSAQMAISLAIGVIVILGAVFAIYVAAANKARRMMTSSRAARRFNRATAAALGGAAAWIAAR